jgi:type II secretory ATPase GspE/PulE/Tfp pilus assembly ATPase PilB-like protein/DNA-binding response OmpR family regulator
MTDGEAIRPRVLYIDDDRDQLTLVERLLADYCDLITVESGREGLQIIDEIKPDLILLDIDMPEMDGYEVCAGLQAEQENAFIPVVFVTAMGEEENRARAFAVGGADFVVKPVKKPELLEKIGTYLAASTAWRGLIGGEEKWQEKMQSWDFIGFKEYVSTRLNFDAKKKYLFSGTAVADIYPAAAKLGIGENILARIMSQFLNLPYITRIAPDTIRLGVMPTAFCKTNHVLPVNDYSRRKGFVVSNPFDQDLMAMLKKHFDPEGTACISVTEPARMDLLFAETPSRPKHLMAAGAKKQRPAPSSMLREERGADHPVVLITDTILNTAVIERASDIHIEPKETDTEVRFRIDGDLRHAFTLKHKTGRMVISRLKAQSGMDISEKRKPQDGGFMATLDNRVFNFRLSTSSTPNGESLVMRLLEPYAAAMSLDRLGMSEKQIETMLGAAGRSSGLILIVGATGSGKTTTIYSLLHSIDHQKRGIMSVEDPVEYRIPFVNQQQVNEKAGVTFDALLKASVRQDPDVLFMGEVRDGFSAKMAIDFASTGHLTISTLHTSNATTAIFRLQRLGIDRGTMADTIIAIVAQKLLKKLCPYCKQIVPVSSLEAEMLRPFTRDIPSLVARPAGCPECGTSGYLGREGVYEVLEFDHQIAEMVRVGKPVSEIRSFSRSRGDFLIGTHAIAKVRSHVFTPREVFERALIEEAPISGKVEFQKQNPEAAAAAELSASRAAILLVEDDEDTRKLLTRFLEADGYTVNACEDGIDALLSLGKQDFALIISDINMPNLDGFKLLEMINQKGLSVPVIFLTSRTGYDDEARGLELGATDYLKKPVQKDMLRLRVKKALEWRQKS